MPLRSIHPLPPSLPETPCPVSCVGCCHFPQSSCHRLSVAGRHEVVTLAPVVVNGFDGSQCAPDIWLITNHCGRYFAHYYCGRYVGGILLIIANSLCDWRRPTSRAPHSRRCAVKIVDIEVLILLGECSPFSYRWWKYPGVQVYYDEKLMLSCGVKIVDMWDMWAKPFPVGEVLLKGEREWLQENSRKWNISATDQRKWNPISAFETCCFLGVILVPLLSLKKGWFSQPSSSVPGYLDIQIIMFVNILIKC